MVLYFIGLGLADEKDITVKGLEIVRRAARVYLEAYTSMLIVDKSKLVSLIPPQEVRHGFTVQILSRTGHTFEGSRMLQLRFRIAVPKVHSH